MQKEISVSITAVAGNASELIIKDRSGITVGRIFVIDFSTINKFGLIRLKLYKKNRQYLKDALNLFLETAFNKSNLRKVDVLVDEDIETEPFVELGFSLEGVLSGSIKVNKTLKDEFVFGIEQDSYRFKNSLRIMKLKGNGIELEVLTPEHAEKLLEYYVRNEEYLRPFEPDRDKDFYTIEAQRRYLSEEYRQFLNGDAVSFGIFKEEELIGRVRISNVIYGVFKNAFIGYSIDEKEQGKGYMKQAVKLSCGYAFEFMDLHRMEASTLVDNIKSQRVLLSCGFKKVGLSEKYLLIHGKWRDHVNFALINERL
ncbi:MAG: ribosomal-protein-alanine acetyltransferase [Firmicutes bacterium]|nr:ribosomal-protein-alanine acetyltransferase [Bacillota bacterium]